MVKKCFRGLSLLTLITLSFFLTVDTSTLSQSCYIVIRIDVEVNSFRPKFSPCSANLEISERKPVVTKLILSLTGSYSPLISLVIPRCHTLFTPSSLATPFSCPQKCHPGYAIAEQCCLSKKFWIGAHLCKFSPTVIWHAW